MVAMFFSPPKLEDCTEHGPGSELFIVEGDSAARTVNTVRNYANQAVWPMQGKPMNAMNADAEDLLDNAQFAGLISSMQVNLSTGQETDELRYERFILLFDPDADGIHARTLMLLFFYKFLRPILEAGRVYGTHAPRWMITSSQLRDPAYAFSEEHYAATRERLDSAGVTDAKVQRFRGLGNVGGPILRKFCLDPASRRVHQLGMEDAEQALAIFEQLRELGRGLKADDAP